jgi:hypothetical protein
MWYAFGMEQDETHTLALALLAELERQFEVGKPGPYVVGEADALDDVLIDGRVDLLALAKALRVAQHA